MKAFTRIFGQVREQLAELGETIAGHQAQRDLDEEIRDTDAHLHEWRANLAGFQAKRLTAQERIDSTTLAITQREAQALAALQAGKVALAREVAAAVVQLEEARDEEHAFVARLDEWMAQMRHLIDQGESSLRRLQHQLDALRAAETLQRAQETVAGRQAGATTLPQTAIESLLRARHQGAGAAAQDGGRNEAVAANPELDAKLEAAGINERDARTQLVLDRIGQRLSEPGMAGPAPPTRSGGRRGRGADDTTKGKR
ncbi:PspA/IM30 family protein [Lysobacter sp. GCM10012299]|uniref:PspA/IM30 family protein n=1 Tax=Lysobacter sp. GCM10012299 TaxID=3317333 RepID=UPI003612C9B6